MADELTTAGYEVFSVDTVYSQVLLSACANSSGTWILAPMANFSQYCGDWDLSTLPTAAPTPLVTECVKGVKGPPCTTNSQCLNVTGCVRCASSGYCTDVIISPTIRPTVAPTVSSFSLIPTSVPTLQPSTLKMVCGPNVGLCGVLTLESGYGPGNYNSPIPEVHGLWPETGSYGTSLCVAPNITASPIVLYSCYNQPGRTFDSCLSFEQHEWTAHGVCAGSFDAADYFTQVCNLSTAPLAIMR